MRIIRWVLIGAGVVAAMGFIRHLVSGCKEEDSPTVTEVQEHHAA